LPVALLESAIALGLAVGACWQLHGLLKSMLGALPYATQ